MIPLDSDKWTHLQHAYGSAEDIPAMLRDICENPYERSETWNQGVWFELWSALCHQGDVYSGSIASVPHIVAGALEAKDGILASDMIALPVSIEESRMKRPEQIRASDIDGDYWNAIIRLTDVCDLASSQSSNSKLLQVIREARRLLSRWHGAPLPQQQEGSDLWELFNAAN